MTISYQDALDQVLEALQRGNPVDALLVAHAEHAGELREDIGVSVAITILAESAVPPNAAARELALARLVDELAAQRHARQPRIPRHALHPYRVAFAGLAAVALALLAGTVVLLGGGTPAEASVIEGIVVENSDGSLTVQTVDRLEEVVVAADAPVSGVSGTAIPLGSLGVGEVVALTVDRPGDDGEPVALKIALVADSLEEWCGGEPGRCEALSQGLAATRRDCLSRPDTCERTRERLDALGTRARDIAALDDLRARCRAGAIRACEEIVTFCHDHVAACRAVAPADSPPSHPTQDVAPTAIPTPISDTSPTAGPVRTVDAQPARPVATSTPNPRPTPEARPQPVADSGVGDSSGDSDRPARTTLTPTPTPPRVVDPPPAFNGR